jgi:hypothetical protein
MMRMRVTLFMLVAAISLAAFARTDETLQQMIARADAAPPGDRPALYIHIAREQADAADKAYQAGNSDAGNAALNDVVTYAGKATDSATSTGKRLKDTEIAVRKMAEKFHDVKHNLPFDDQAPVQEAIDKLEKMRTEMLSAMFGKKGNK